MNTSIGWLDRHFVSATTLDEDGIGHMNPTEFLADGDDKVTAHTLIGHLPTTDATVQHVELFDVSADEVLAVDIVVTVGPAAQRARFKLSALIWGNGATATIDGTVDVDKKPPASALAATITVSGSKVRLSLTGIAATDLTWGWEARAQRQVA